VHYSAFAGEPVFADDSGLEVDALNGAPGVYSARFAGEGASDEANNRLLIEDCAALNTDGAVRLRDRGGARGEVLATFRGAVEGRIVDDARGPNGFGYDPHFFHEPFGCTFGEAAPERKMGVSHRGQALRALLEWAGERR
jgi:XTP/dITP diphosphohydrolase